VTVDARQDERAEIDRPWLQIDRRGRRLHARVLVNTASPMAHGLSPDGLSILLDRTLGREPEPRECHLAPRLFGSCSPMEGDEGTWAAWTRRGLRRKLDKRLEGWQALPQRGEAVSA